MSPSTAAEEPWLFSSFRSRCVCFRPRFRQICRPIYPENPAPSPAGFPPAGFCLNRSTHPLASSFYSPFPLRQTDPPRKQIPIGFFIARVPDHHLSALLPRNSPPKGMAMSQLIERLPVKARRGSKPRCHLLTHGTRQEVADRLTDLIHPWGQVRKSKSVFIVHP